MPARRNICGCKQSRLIAEAAGESDEDPPAVGAEDGTQRAGGKAGQLSIFVQSMCYILLIPYLQVLGQKSRRMQIWPSQLDFYLVQ
jgi:hypothetical protein